MAVSPRQMKPGDVALVRVPRFANTSTIGGSKSYEERGVRIVQLYPRFFVAIVRRGEALVKEAFRYEDVIKINPDGIEAPVLGPRDVTHVMIQPDRMEVARLARGPFIPADEAFEALRMHRQGASLDEIADRFGVDRERARSMIRKAERIERARAVVMEKAAETAPLSESKRNAPSADSPAPSSNRTVDLAQVGAHTQQLRIDELRCEFDARMQRVWEEIAELRRALAKHVHLPTGQAVIAEDIEEFLNRR